MGHTTGGGVYARLQQRLDRHTVGMPDSEIARRLLMELFRPEEASLAARLPLMFKSVGSLSRKLGIPERELDDRLQRMAERGQVFDLEKRGKRYYMLAPTIVGLFEFTMMRVRDDIDQKAVAHLLHEYFLQDERYARQAFEGQTQIGRALVHETVLPDDGYAEILDWERTSRVVEEATAWSVGLCYCRHSREHRGYECEYPMDVCMSLGVSAEFTARHGHARAIDRKEAMDILERTRDLGLVHVGDNVQKRLTYICSCCSCCCEMLTAVHHFRMPGAIVSSNWIPETDPKTCKGCGRCARSCPVGAITLEGRGGGRGLVAKVDPEYCLGCGVCVPRCRTGSMKMVPREQRVFVPESTSRRVALMALERGKLQDLLIDTEGPLPARALSAFMRTIAELPPVKQRVAGSQLRSTFVDAFLGGLRSPHMTWLKRI